MLRKFSIVAALLGLAAVAFAALAPAAAAEEERDGTFLRGRGVLTARGDGLVAVKGHIDLRARADGGILLVKDIAGDADVEVEGYGDSVEWNGFAVYFGFQGEAHVTGSDVGVVVVGRNIGLHVVGKGWAFLKGAGVYYVNNRGPFRWTEDGVFAAVVSDASDSETDSSAR